MPGAETVNPGTVGKPGMPQISIRAKVEQGKHTGYTTQGGSVSACESVTEFLPGPGIDFLYKLRRDQLG